MQRFQSAKQLSDSSGIPVKVIAGLAGRGYFTTIRVTSRSLLIDVVDFREYLAKRTTPKSRSL